MKHTFEALEVRKLLAAITGRVFHDLNANGTASSNEGGVGGAVVYADLNNDAKRQSTEPQATSGSSGAYTISSASLLKGKTYKLRLIPPSGFAGTASTSVYLSGTTTKASDLGTWKYAKVTLKAFLDVNKNYKLDSGEPDLGGVKYWDDVNDNLRQDSTDPVYGPGTVTVNLKPGFHRVQPANLLTGHRFVTTTVGTFSVTSGQVTTGAAFGYYYPAKYAGHVYQDKNKNGKYDAGEGIGGRRVFADADNDNHQDEGEYGAITDSAGLFTIGLDPGTFTLRQVLPNGWTGSAGKKVTVAGSSYNTVSGNDLFTAPSAIATHGTVKGYVFNDANANGKQDSGEGNWTQAFGGGRGLPNVFIDLDKDGHLDNDERVEDVQPDGTFSFADVLPGTYRFVA